MNDRQREELLERIYKTGATVGGSIPETVTVADESIPLREFFFEVSGRKSLSSEDRERVDEILQHLRRERLRLVQQIKHDEVDYETGRELVPRILELERAIDALEGLEAPGLAEHVRQEKIASAQELIDLMREFGKK